jgi:hypothetical protein
MYLSKSLSSAEKLELHIFSDASEKEVSAVAYIKSCDDNISLSRSVGFVMGKCKLAPSHGHSVPRLELCAALLATEVGEIVTEALKVSFQAVNYYSDSRVVLGYITNTKRRFYNYVSNRVHRILSLSRADQWKYINTKTNPADIGTRGCSTLEQLGEWISGPSTFSVTTDILNCEFPLISPDDDKEIRQEAKVYKTTINSSITEKFPLFSSWKRLIIAFAVLKRAILNFRIKKSSGVLQCGLLTQECVYKSECFILKADQQQSFGEDTGSIGHQKPVSRGSPIHSLNPFLDKDGVMRVGGRLNQSCLPVETTNPVILSSKSHVARLIVCHFHEKCKHQGRLLTEATIRNNGFWIVGAKRLISKILYDCVICRKLRRKTENQMMADLPVDRLTPGPPFTAVGVDVFGPWTVVTRRTRGGIAQSKRWAVLFTCLTTRAVHIEVLEEMSSSSFINGLRRFIAIRGNVKEFRSDRGSNFIGSTQDLKVNVINVEDGPVPKYLCESGVTWKFNAPHSSHMGGVWERMIGIARKILDGMLLGAHGKHLTHEILITLMAEVCAIMNSRPLGPISSDPNSPWILTPAMLLNQKFDGTSTVNFDIDQRHMYQKQWKMAQVLSNIFWKQWKDSYIHTLQSRRKWQTSQNSIKEGDVVLLKDKDQPRNEWSVGIVTNAIQSESDGKVRKAEIRVFKNGKLVTYTRPVTEMVVLLSQGLLCYE